MVNHRDHEEQRLKQPVRAQNFKAGVREEEICQIFNLKKNLDYSDVLIKYASKYLKLGWDLVAVNAQGGTTLDLDFKQPEEMWSPRLTTMGLEGLQVNLGVRTGKPSRLVVLEVHRNESLAPFNQPGDWGSGCVAEVGNDREQHYFMVPRGWEPPPSYFLESFQIMVFGEEGMVLAPPSLEPRAQAALRWLRPPWENPPTRPSPALCKFLKESTPSLVEGAPLAAPRVPSWAEIYPIITKYPAVLQALLAPAAKPEDYYQSLVAAARGSGLDDPQVVLGLLWHAPMGNNGLLTQRWEYFRRLVYGHGEDLEKPLSGPQPGSLPPFQEAGASGPMGPEHRGTGANNGGKSQEAGVPGFTAGGLPPANGSQAPRRGNGRAPQPGGEDYFDSWSELFRFSQDHLIVDRRRYEAMIYELGKLGAWQEFFKGQQRENRSLREKIESHWAKELEFLRQLSSKNHKKGWPR
jgi:hypothetical protein|uniref:DNA primase/polymerase bifunctional N-terminal domain-containing protein n=1 Tax=Desulfobacca acetoxidans TaxID=60893 RepID=A0A7C3Z0K6_9BACT